MLLETGDLKPFEIEISDERMLPVREAAQALIIARQRAERAVEEGEENEYPFLSKNLQLRLERLIKKVEDKGWLAEVPKQIDLGYTNDITIGKNLSLRAKLIYLTRGPALVTVAEIQNSFLGFKWKNLDKFHPRDPLEEDWFKTEPVDIHLFAAIPDTERKDVLSPFFIPENVRANLA